MVCHQGPDSRTWKRQFVPKDEGKVKEGDLAYGIRAVDHIRTEFDWLVSMCPNENPALQVKAEDNRKGGWVEFLFKAHLKSYIFFFFFLLLYPCMLCWLAEFYLVILNTFT